MRRREFITFLGAGAAVATSLSYSHVRARQPERMRRIGWLDIPRADDPSGQARAATVRQDLEKASWIVGRNLQIDYRWGATNAELAQRLGAELLDRTPDVIFCGGSPGVKWFQEATSTVPIVFALVTEPVAQGFVHSLAHPGANITGFAFLERTIGAKWLALLIELAPKVKRVAYVFSPKSAPYAGLYYEAAESVAGKMGVETQMSPVNESADIEAIIARLSEDGGMILNPDAFTNDNLALAIDLAARYRVPAMYGNPGGAAMAGGLMSYSIDLLDHYRQAGGYLDRILKGEKPADLPVQQPTKFQLVINLKTARALGIAVPLTLQASADEVIE